MAHPKRKTSKTKKRTRRAAWNNKFQFASVHKCSNCGEAKVTCIKYVVHVVFMMVSLVTEPNAS